MPASLIRSRAMITRALDRHRWEEIADGAVLQEDGTITAVGTFADLSPQTSDRAGDRHAATRSCCLASSTAITMSG